MIDEITLDTDERMTRSVDVLRNDLARLRTGKASINLLDGITVSYYGVPTPLNQVANINAPEARLLTIQPWDKSIIGEIEKAIQKSDLGINPNNDGIVIRLPLPQLTKEVRADLSKQAKKKGEDAKVSIRNIRRDANEQIKKIEKSKDIAEDESKTAQEEIQKLTDKFVVIIDKVIDAKIVDIMEI